MSNDAPPGNDADARPGLEIPGFEMQRQLGAGGMATVYLALQRSLNRKVAIKVMHRKGADENAAKRFLLEGRTLAKLPHANIVGVYDIVQTDQIEYIVMEHLAGGVLSERMATGWLTLNDYIGFIVQIAGALQYAHDNGVVHRDLKPDNILFRDAKTPVLTDFGIARASAAQHTRITATGTTIGTPTYMSPEQASGDEVDGRSDQYSLGVLFYEMLAQKPPFEAENALKLAFAHVYTPAPPLPKQYEFAQPILDKMLAKKPADRYPDMKAFIADMKNVLVADRALQKKLQIEPTNNISDQLKALGFAGDKANTPPVVLELDLPPAELANSLLKSSKLSLEPVVHVQRKVKETRPPLPVGKILTWIVLLFVIAAAIKVIMHGNLI